MRTEPSRTFIGSVACVDLVGYSRRSVAQQMQVKQAFNRVLVDVLAPIPSEDRIVLDTGDGAAIAFLADPETCLRTCIALRDAMNGARGEFGCGPNEAPMRIGVNLGPMRLALDVNGRPNIVGDGVVSAERIMPLAEPGQVVASRSFHEMVSHISEDLAGLFEPAREGQDRAGLTRMVFPVRPAGSTRPVPPRAGDPDAREMTQVFTKPKAPPAAPAVAAPAAASQAAPVAAPVAPDSALATFLRDRPKVGATAAVLVAIIALEGWALSRRGAASENVASAPSQPTVAKPVETAPAIVPVVPPPVTGGTASSPPSAAKAPVVPAPPPATIAKAPEKPAEKSPPKPPEKVAEKPAPVPEKRVDPKPPEKAAEKTPEKAPERVAAKPPPEKAPEPRMPEKTPEKAPSKAVVPPPPEPQRRVVPPKDTPPASPAVASAPITAPPPAAPIEPPVVREEPRPAPPTTTATPTYRPGVEFPVAVAARGITEGVVRARLTINAAGNVTNVQVTASEPPRAFDREAVRTLQTWRFNPGADNRSYDVEVAFKR